MKKNVHMFSLVLLLFTYLVAPVTGIAQTQEVSNQSSMQATEQTTSLSEEQIKEQTTNDTVKTTEQSQTVAQTAKSVKENKLNFKESQPRAPSVKASSVQASIDVTNPIKSQEKVTATITIQGSQGAMSPGSTLIVDIPQNVVDSAGLDLSAAQLQGFDGPVLQVVDGKYQLIYTKNSVEVAGGQQATIIWKAPLWQNNDNPGTIESELTYTDSLHPENNTSDSAHSDTQAGNKPTLPSLAKWTLMSNIDFPNYEAVALMNPNNGTSNVYDLPVNYTQENLSSAIVTDTLPEDTHFEYPGRSVQNDLSSTGNVRILKVLSRNAEGWPSSFENVSNLFNSSISISGRELIVDFGESMKNGDSYVIEYAVQADKGQSPTTYGVRDNKATLGYKKTMGEEGTKNTHHYQAIDENTNGAFTFEKKVTQTEYLTGSKYLDYTITLTNEKDFDLPAGSRIEDPLISGLTYDSTGNDSININTSPLVNGNNVTWATSKKLETGESAVIKFRVKVDEVVFKNGDNIDNTAVLHRDGARDISTNTSSVYVYNGRIKILKTDFETGNALAGAEFDILDTNGNVIEHVLTDSNGTSMSDPLPEGNYIIRETKAPEGYILSNKEYPVVLNYQNSQEGVVTINITNEKESSVTLSGTKTWNDNNNQDGVRPNSITVNLLANGQVVDTKTVTADEKWKYSFTNLPKYENGNEIVYTITEDAVPSYTTTVDGTNLTNTYTPGKTSVTVTKAWDDNNDQDGLRPDSIQVQLYANGKAQGDPATLNVGSDWTYTWSDLDQKLGGKDIAYTVKEVSNVPGYEVSIDNSNQGNIMITNKHTVKPPHSGNDDHNKPHKTENKKIKDILPHTGDSSTLSFITMVIGLVILALGATLTTLKLKK